MTKAENAWLVSKPTEAKIEEVIQNFPTGKSLGINGVTYEMLQETWPFIKQGCFAMVATFWGDGKISKKMASSIIKLIPKGLLLTIMGNWRPLTMLTSSYKFLSKIIANKVVKIIARLICKKKTGFTSRWSIFDNIMALKLGQDHTRCTKQEAYLFKADNEKAYDNLHLFLWDILAAIGFDPFIINLIKGLVSEATSKVHVNNIFTYEIDLQRDSSRGTHWAPSFLC